MEIFVQLPKRFVQVCGRRVIYGNNGCSRRRLSLSSSSSSPLSLIFVPKCLRPEELKLRICTSNIYNQCHYLNSRTFCTRRKTSASAQRKEQTESTVEDKKDNVTNDVGAKDSESEGDFKEQTTTDLTLRRKKERRRLSDLILKKPPEEEAKDKQRYEKDVPPVEEERHKYWKSRPERSVNKALIRTDFFEEVKDKTKENFIITLEIFTERDIHLRGHVEFIYAALSQMKKFGIHRDLEAYKKIIDIFPKGHMIQTNMFQVEFMHYPKQQQCGIDILEQMEEMGVCPDTEVQQMLTNIFGSQSFPMRKASRMLYWMPKFSHISPWRLPDPLPDDCLELAKLAMQRITSVDLSTKINVHYTEQLEDACDTTWIVSAQSPDQQKLIESHPSNQPIYVEGAFRVWLRRVCINYFVLRAEPKPEVTITRNPDDVSDLPAIYEEDFVDKTGQASKTVHEQDDGVILGVCATGTSSRDSVISWIRFLEQSNPRLGKDISVLFTLKSPIGPTDDIEILSFEEAEEIKRLTGPEESFSVSSGGKLGVDPRLPNLKQVGIWSESESQFPNWPHYHHAPDSNSLKNLEVNQKLLEELEENVAIKKSPIKTIVDSSDGSSSGDQKQIK